MGDLLQLVDSAWVLLNFLGPHKNPSKRFIIFKGNWINSPSLRRRIELPNRFWTWHISIEMMDLLHSNIISEMMNPIHKTRKLKGHMLTFPSLDVYTPEIKPPHQKYPKIWWFLRCISFQIWLVWVSILVLGGVVVFLFAAIQCVQVWIFVLECNPEINRRMIVEMGCETPWVHPKKLRKNYDMVFDWAIDRWKHLSLRKIFQQLSCYSRLPWDAWCVNWYWQKFGSLVGIVVGYGCCIMHHASQIEVHFLGSRFLYYTS